MLLIKSGTIYTMESEQPIKGDILLDNGKIIKIADKIENDNNMEVYDASGCRIYPGFIDAHYDGNPLEIASSVKATIINGRIVWNTEEEK